jgi:hypothetical protein
MTFRIGQKVVCVDTVDSKLIFGGIYTIKKVIPRHCQWRGVVAHWTAVQLYEEKAEAPFCGFCSERFKPVDERKTDISDLRAILMGSIIETMDR